MSNSSFPVSVKHTRYAQAPVKPPKVAVERSSGELLVHLLCKKIDMVFLIVVAALALAAMYRHELVLDLISADASNVQGIIMASLIV